MLEKQIKGSIINIGSVAALRGFAAGKRSFFDDPVEACANALLSRCCLYFLQAWSCGINKEHSFLLHGQGYSMQCCAPVRDGDQYLQDHHEHQRRGLRTPDEGTCNHGKSQGSCSDCFVPGLRCLEHNQWILHRYGPWLRSFLKQAQTTDQDYIYYNPDECNIG